MKIKYFLLFIAGFMFCFAACKKDGNTIPSFIAGKWSIVKTIYHNALDTTINGLATDYYNFGTNGALTIQDHQDNMTGVYTLNGIKSMGINIYTENGHGFGVTTPPAIFAISDFGSNSLTLTSPAYPTGQYLVYLRR
jgi:hypothetical protein